MPAGFVVRVGVVGPEGSGKSCLVRRACYGTFHPASCGGSPVERHAVEGSPRWLFHDFGGLRHCRHAGAAELAQCDVIWLVDDGQSRAGGESDDEGWWWAHLGLHQPLIRVRSKTDLLALPPQPVAWQQQNPSYDCAVSALEGRGIAELMDMTRPYARGTPEREPPAKVCACWP